MMSEDDVPMGIPQAEDDVMDPSGGGSGLSSPVAPSRQDPFLSESQPLPKKQKQKHHPQTTATNSDAPLQGIENVDIQPLLPPFTEEELQALIKDLNEWRVTFAKQIRQEEAATVPPVPSEAGTATMDTSVTPAAIVATDTSAASPPAVRPSTRPFLASWSCKEVCSWYLQVAQQLHVTPTFTGAARSATSTKGELLSDNFPPDNAVMAFVQILQKHSIDGSRLLAFTSDPLLIPLISPQLLSRILYLRGLDTYSHMFQPLAGDIDHAHSIDPNMVHLRDILASTVKIFCTSTPPDFARMWAQKDQSVGTSSGFVISGRRIIGNAHGATSATNIRVRKHGDATKYKATVTVISHECDLVILEVASEKFWTGLIPLEFGHVPRLQDTVIVVGYPTGGDSICVTKGVVSRILVSNYTHSDESLLTVQIDAAINPGNSGGPVLLNGAVVGVAFQGVASAQSVGYIIPIPVVMHFLTDLQLHGKYTGFPSFYGLLFQRLENESLKKYYGLSENETGVVVMDRAPLDGSHAVLENGDVVTHIDGIPVADDESIFFRFGERISCRYLPSSKFVGDRIKLRIVRKKEPMEVSFILQARRHLVPCHLYDTHPSYYIMGGLVFTFLSRPYLRDTFGSKWHRASSVELINAAYFGSLEFPEQQIVILSSIMVDDVNTGYGSGFHNIILDSVNGTKIRNLKHLVDVCESEHRAGVPFLRFDFTLNRLIVLETKPAFEATPRILLEKKIEFDRSIDLRTPTTASNSVNHRSAPSATASSKNNSANGASKPETKEPEPTQLSSTLPTTQ